MIANHKKSELLIKKRSNMSEPPQGISNKIITLVKPRDPLPRPGDIQSSSEIHLTLLSGGNRLAGDLLSKPGMRGASTEQYTLKEA